MLDIKKVKQMLENGEEVRLECVDRSAFINDELNEKTRYNKRCMTDFDPLVCRVSTTGIVMADGFYIDEDEFKYFRIAEAKQTFDDVIDVVVKAYKNRLLDIFLMNNEVITVFNHDDTGTKESINRADTSKYYQFINFINSLYTETFVIDNEEDIMKVNIRDDSAKITLANKTELKLSGSQDSGNQDGFALGLLLPNGCVVCYGISVLKGATVTQKRGSK